MKTSRRSCQVTVIREQKFRYGWTSGFGGRHRRGSDKTDYTPPVSGTVRFL